MDKNNNSTKEYTNGAITVIWESGKCIHSANCVRHSPKVFNTRQRPWIKMDQSPTTEIIATVNKCPSGALSFYYNNEKSG